MLTPANLADQFNEHLYGPIKWGKTLTSSDTGVYIVTLLETSTQAKSAALPHAPIDLRVVQVWLSRVPQFTLDGKRPTASAISERIANFWIPDEIILYIGQTGSELSKRLNQYYTHKLGNRSPHKGGHWLKTLSNLKDLCIYWVENIDPKPLEQQMLNYFQDQVSDESRKNLYDPNLPIPFANLEITYPSRQLKQHGLKKHALPRKPKS